MKSKQYLTLSTKTRSEATPMEMNEELFETQTTLMVMTCLNMLSQAFTKIIIIIVINGNIV